MTAQITPHHQEKKRAKGPPSKAPGSFSEAPQTKIQEEKAIEKVKEKVKEKAEECEEGKENKESEKAQESEKGTDGESHEKDEQGKEQEKKQLLCAPADSGPPKPNFAARDTQSEGELDELDALYAEVEQKETEAVVVSLLKRAFSNPPDIVRAVSDPAAKLSSAVADVGLGMLGQQRPLLAPPVKFIRSHSLNDIRVQSSSATNINRHDNKKEEEGEFDDFDSSPDVAPPDMLRARSDGYTPQGNHFKMDADIDIKNVARRASFNV